MEGYGFVIEGHLHVFNPTETTYDVLQNLQNCLIDVQSVSYPKRVSITTNNIIKPRIKYRCVLESIDGEYWYEPIKKSCRQSKDDSAFSEQSGRKHRPFVTFLANEKTKEIVQLTFDKTLFSRNHTADYFLTDEIRKVLQIAPANRNSEQNLELTRFMKRACNAFQQYPYSIQRQLAQFMVYDRYMPNRMVVKEGLMADGMYFVLSGYLYGKDSETKDMVEVKPGDGYGVRNVSILEEDIKCGCTRRATLVTPEIVELVAIHQKDYRNIFNMSVDTSDARCLDICK
ncbi:hypothetical protein CAPTEDRAFT_196406 [Capitella teleta]|uniref:Cyclic nucleotide-binding domain-containing protein n=1 Tax=Capitella teleta TaxID=283909 RepID=R7T7E1_CAPTE|nr:hypothetical protein CAPTEDRAFT_196406 [Capitella teleta]|eukprot:ELT89520.1 hypothetical protein CAPTEDRAFT_196406 [Capitella teleta]